MYTLAACRGPSDQTRGRRERISPHIYLGMTTDAAGNNHHIAGAPKSLGGKFAEKVKDAPVGVQLMEPHPTDFSASVPIAAVVTIGTDASRELPPWPADIEKPDVFYEYCNDRIETFFSIAGGTESVTLWDDRGDAMSTQNDGAEPAVTFADEDEEDAAMEWMRAVHERIDGEAYGVAIAAQTPAVMAAVVAAGLGEVQPMRQYRTSEQGSLARADAMLTVSHPELADVNFNRGPDPDQYEVAGAVQDALTDFRHWAQANGVDIEDAFARSGVVFDDEMRERES